MLVLDILKFSLGLHRLLECYIVSAVITYSGRVHIEMEMSDTHSTLIADLDEFSREIDNEWNRTMDEISVMIKQTRKSIAMKCNTLRKELITTIDKHKEHEKNNNYVIGLQGKEYSLR